MKSWRWTLHKRTTLLTVSPREAVGANRAQVREAQRRIGVDERRTWLLDEARGRAGCLALRP